MPAVSVLCPVYNMKRFLPEAVDSVLRQEGVDFEVIIVNDGSTDGVESYLASLDNQRVRVLTLAENGGKCRAMNEAFAHISSNCRYIALVDAEDVWKPLKLARQCAVLDAEPDIAGVFTHVRCINAEGETDDAAAPGLTASFNQLAGLAPRDLILRSFFYMGNFINNSSSVFRRAALDGKEPFFDIRLQHLHDQDLWVRLAMRGGFFFIPKPLVRYRVHGGNQNANNERAFKRSRIEEALIMERFARMTDTALFTDIFFLGQDKPDIKAECIPHHVALFALEHDNKLCAAWGMLYLGSLLKTEEGAQALERNCGFALNDFYALQL